MGSYIMVDSSGKDKKDFDTKKWAERNENLAKKSFERWKEENLNGGKVKDRAVRWLFKEGYEQS